MNRDNNFNLLRMIAASAVIVSHSYPLSLGPGAEQPLESVLPFSLGAVAVKSFFAVSGYLIMQSWERQKSFVTFTVARYARVVPGLALVLLVTWLAMPPLAANPYPNLQNGSLWTLWYEWACYNALAVVGLTCGWRGFMVGYAVFYAAVTSRYLPMSEPCAFLSLPFVIGAAVQRNRLSIKGTVALALVGLAIAVAFIGWRADELWMLAISYGSLWLGHANLGLLTYNRVGDYSYGTYIYGWPVQQLLAYSVAGISPLQMMALALPIAWTLGAISWHLVEGPSLAWAKSSARRLLEQGANGGAVGIAEGGLIDNERFKV